MNILSLFNGGETKHRGTPWGAGLVAHETDDMIANGMGRLMTVGAFATGVGGGAAAIIDIDQPQFVVGVPTGYAIRPVRISAQVQEGLAAADNEESQILFAVDSKGLWSLDGTRTAEFASNMRTELGVGSICLTASAFSADMTTTQPGIAAADPVLDMELARAVKTTDVMGTATTVFMKALDLVYEPRHAPLIVGPATLIGYWGGTVEPIGGFAQVAWVEGRTGDFFRRA